MITPHFFAFHIISKIAISPVITGLFYFISFHTISEYFNFLTAFLTVQYCAHR
nr:MAG TPA: hypothetical protein [Caudoviricetes sp.]